MKSVLFSLLFSMALAYLPYRDKYPQIISHRGASGYIPEHSLQAYEVAINLGTDYVEPDLCLTKDGVFVAMHDILLDETTDVASHPEFDDKYTTKVVDGDNTTGYFVCDFTLAEITTLRLKQRVSYRSTIFNGFFTIPTFTQIMSMMQNQYNDSGFMIGIYPELKHPSFHHSLGFEMEDMLLESLIAGGYAINGEYAFNNLSTVVPVIIQCFEEPSLRYLRQKTSLPLMQLVKPVLYGKIYMTNAMLENIGTYATAIGPEKTYFYPENMKHAQKAIDKMRELKLAIHPWTFRADDTLSPPFTDNFAAEENYFYQCLKMDAVFTEFPDQTRETIDNLKHGAMLTSNTICPM